VGELKHKAPIVVDLELKWVDCTRGKFPQVREEQILVIQYLNSALWQVRLGVCSSITVPNMYVFLIWRRTIFYLQCSETSNM
jgi:hypothetical protein